MTLGIRLLAASDRAEAVRVINAAALWYREFLPPEELRPQEMTAEEWDAEARRLGWYGAFAGETLVGVMGLERATPDVVLLRHAYVLPAHQRRGVGSRLRERLEQDARAAGARRSVIGTYGDNYKARAALEGAGYRLSAGPEAILRRYYRIPEDRLRASVTYEKALQPGSG